VFHSSKKSPWRGKKKGKKFMAQLIEGTGWGPPHREDEKGGVAKKKKKGTWD